MFETTRGTPVPARRRLLALVFALVAAGPIAAAPTVALADDGLVDVRTLPRLEGAVERADHTTPHSLTYAVPTPVTVTSPTTATAQITILLFLSLFMNVLPLLAFYKSEGRL